jgi:predicted nucleic acid-binding protein
MDDALHALALRAIKEFELEEQHLRIKAVMGNRPPQDLLDAIIEAEAEKADA